MLLSRVLLKLITFLFLALPMQAAIIANIEMAVYADGGGPQSSCVYEGPGPAAECSVRGAYGEGQAMASLEGTLLSVGSGGNGGWARVYATATLDALYYTAFDGGLTAIFDYQCAAGGNVGSGWAGVSSDICGVGIQQSSKDQPFNLAVQAVNGAIHFNVSWYAATSTLGDQEYAQSNLTFLGFRDGAGNPITATTERIAAASVVPEPATWGLMGGALVLFLLARKRLTAIGEVRPE